MFKGNLTNMLILCEVQSDLVRKLDILKYSEIKIFFTKPQRMKYWKYYFKLYPVASSPAFSHIKNRHGEPKNPI